MLAAITLGSIVSWAGSASAARRHRSSSYEVVPAGSTLNVRVDDKVSTEDANRGDGWSGTVSNDVVVDGRVLIPAGSAVTGMVTSAAQGTHSTRPHLGLAVRQVNIDGRWYPVRAETDPIVGGTKRAKKIGAVAGGAAAGALLGGIVGGKKGALLGGLLGGGAGYGLTRNALRTLQIKEGTVVAFTIREDVVAMR
jgi:hypothetical protein